MRGVGKIIAGVAIAGGTGLIGWYFFFRKPAKAEAMWKVGDILACGEEPPFAVLKITDMRFSEGDWHYHVWEYSIETGQIVEDLGWMSESQLLGMPCSLYPGAFQVEATLSWTS